MKINLLKPLLIVISVGFVVSCGTSVAKDFNDNVIRPMKGEAPPRLNLVPEVDAVLLPYYNDFVADAKARNRVLPTNLESIKLVDEITVDKPADGLVVIGVCIFNEYANSQTINTVQISKMMTRDATQLKTVIYHELGHCLLNLKHTAPDSNQIMEPVANMSDDYINANWTDLVNYEFNSPS